VTTVGTKLSPLEWGSARRMAATYTQNNTNTEYTHTQTSMPRVGSEPMIPAFERAKTVDALDRAVTVIGKFKNLGTLNVTNHYEQQK
jgi:hypothetical protein